MLFASIYGVFVQSLDSLVKFLFKSNSLVTYNSQSDDDK